MTVYAIIEPTDIEHQYRIVNLVVADDSSSIHGNHVICNKPNEIYVGSFYDANHQQFYTKAPFGSWKLNKTTWKWDAPAPKPNDGKNYHWDDLTDAWKEVVVDATDNPDTAIDSPDVTLTTDK